MHDEHGGHSAEGSERGVVAAWHAAATDPAVAAELEAVFADIAAQVESRGPACWASGRCCHFDRAGHLLYVTGLEAAYTLARSGGVQEGVGGVGGVGACPFQAGNLCTVHGIKPVGCRVYFCDRSAEDWQQRLSEHALSQLRAIHDRHGVPYRYDEWRRLIAIIRASTRDGGGGGL